MDAQSDPANQISVSELEGVDSIPKVVAPSQTPSSQPNLDLADYKNTPVLFKPYSDGMPFVRSQPKGVAPFPIELSAAVKHYVDAYMAQPQGLEESFRRCRPYMAEMVQVMRQEGLPDDLIYLSFAESAFSDTGDGPWQLSKETARRFGLVINQWLDERRDPIKSTRAAAEYLAMLHDEAGADWRMTLVAWNNGDARLNHYLRLSADGYARLMQKLPERTRALMNRFMAVDVIARNADQYGINTIGFYEAPQYRLMDVKGGVLLSQVAVEVKTSVEALREANPALLQDRIPPNVETYQIRIPDPELASALSEL
ncbi:MAG TPA: transglycosylase SLT domain-containing protein [Candidatus Binataceae bacterium]|nr:transglycosylase SLT domain-containing protein [Candidatus Binataceae bacterium]